MTSPPPNPNNPNQPLQSLPNHTSSLLQPPPTGPPITITSDEINFLVYRYLQESGFVHSAFSFAYESMLTKSTAQNADLPPGALVTFVQKGLMYLGIEEHLNEDGTERMCEEEVGGCLCFVLFCCWFS